MDSLAKTVATRFKESEKKLPVVYIPSQTSVGFSVIVPTQKDAEDLTRFIARSKLGRMRARTRSQKSYVLKAIELFWIPSDKMPNQRDFQQVVDQWARRHNYSLAKDMRELRRGLDAVRA